MQISSDFWNAQKGLLLVGDDGAIRFTRTGRAKYAPLLARYGFALDNVKTIQKFEELMSHVSYGELEENTRELEKLMNDPATSDVEREVIRRALAADCSK
jgi:hypothetical protein